MPRRIPKPPKEVEEEIKKKVKEQFGRPESPFIKPEPTDVSSLANVTEPAKPTTPIMELEDPVIVPHLATDKFGNIKGYVNKAGQYIQTNETEARRVLAGMTQEKAQPGEVTGQSLAAAEREAEQAEQLEAAQLAFEEGAVTQEFVPTEEAEPIDVSLADAYRGALLESIIPSVATGATATASAFIGAKALAAGLSAAPATGGLSLLALGGIALTSTGIALFSQYTKNVRGEHLEDIDEVGAVVNSAVGRGFSTLKSEVERGTVSVDQGRVMLQWIDDEMDYAERLIQKKRMQGAMISEYIDTDAKKVLLKIKAYKTKYRLYLENALDKVEAGLLLDPNSPELVFDPEEFEEGQ